MRCLKSDYKMSLIDLISIVEGRQNLNIFFIVLFLLMVLNSWFCLNCSILVGDCFRNRYLEKITEWSIELDSNVVAVLSLFFVQLNYFCEIITHFVQKYMCVRCCLRYQNHLKCLFVHFTFAFYNWYWCLVILIVPLIVQP